MDVHRCNSRASYRRAQLRMRDDVPRTLFESVAAFAVQRLTSKIKTIVSHLSSSSVSLSGILLDILNCILRCVDLYALSVCYHMYLSYPNCCYRMCSTIFLTIFFLHS